MSLFDRLRGIEQPRINAHAFQAVMAEWADSAVGFSRAEIINQFKLIAADEPELDTLKAHYDNTNINNVQEKFYKRVDSIFMLIGDRDLTFYPTNAEVNVRLTEASS